MEQQTFKYFAFISYNARDTEWGKRLQRKLEHYRMPSTLCSEHGWNRTPIKPVFFAPTDIQPGGLTEELQERLRASHHLIVICSPNSARSEWVGREIEFFHQLGRTKQIHFFIVEGEPHSGREDTECFNPIISTLGLPEMLGANINEKIYRWAWLNKERAYVQLISKLLGVEFDTIWQRHKRLLIQKSIAWGVGVVAVASLWGVTIRAVSPFTSEIALRETSVANGYLPPCDGAVTTLYLDDEVLTDTVRQGADRHVFARIPHRYKDENVRVTFSHPDFAAVDTLLPLTEHPQLNIRRNPDTYGHIRFRLWNARQETPVTHCAVTISNTDGKGQGGFSCKAVSDDNGFVDVNIPLEHQRTAYTIAADVPLESATIYMPCGESDVVLVR